MIQSKKGMLKIEGSTMECLLDFQHIYSELLHISPEIVLAVTGAFLDESGKALEVTAEDIIKEMLAICLHTKDLVEGEDND